MKLSQYSIEKVVLVIKTNSRSICKNAILDPKFYKGEYKYFNGKLFFGTDGSLPDNNFYNLIKLLLEKEITE